MKYPRINIKQLADGSGNPRYWNRVIKRIWNRDVISLNPQNLKLLAEKFRGNNYSFGNMIWGMLGCDREYYQSCLWAETKKKDQVEIAIKILNERLK